MRVLHVSSEVAPFSKTGGLGDVVAALPQALSALGVEACVATPRYQHVDVSGFIEQPPLEVELGFATEVVRIFETIQSAVRIFFVDHPPSFARSGLYGEHGGDYPDNARRFALFGAAASKLGALVLRPDVLHAHDWQAAPALIYNYARRDEPDFPSTVFTIHNLAFQGRFPGATMDELGFTPELFDPRALEYYGDVNFLKGAVLLADRVTTVSPRYASEIQTSEFGVGLDGVLRQRRQDLVGILNGIDDQVWDPARDVYLPAHFDAANLEGKEECKRALQREFGLPEVSVPLSAAISRLSYQKGFDLITQALPDLLTSNMQFVVLGSGDRSLEEALTELSKRTPEKMAVRIAYDDRLAHLIEAGADLLVVPSRYEPCGLTQLYALRYGTIPIVRATGGLDDSIIDIGESTAGTGFKFSDYSKSALTEACQRAFACYASAGWKPLVERAMAQDFSWRRSARDYLDLYSALFHS